MGEAMEETFELKIITNETTKAFTVPVFRRKELTCRQKPELRRFAWTHRLRSLRRATVMSATRRSWEFGEISTAIRTSFPSCPPLRWSHGTLGVAELEDLVEDESRDHVDFGGDVELEFEIEAVVGALEPIQKSDALAVPSRN